MQSKPVHSAQILSTHSVVFPGFIDLNKLQKLLDTILYGNTGRADEIMVYSSENRGKMTTLKDDNYNDAIIFDGNYYYYYYHYYN